MSENNDFIQLPPIKKDTPSEVVSMIWQYLKLPEESRKRVKAELINVHENCGKEDFQIPNLYDIVPKDEIAEFEDIMRKIITGIISEANEDDGFYDVYTFNQNLQKRLRSFAEKYPEVERIFGGW